MVPPPPRLYQCGYNCHCQRAVHAAEDVGIHTAYGQPGQQHRQMHRLFQAQLVSRLLLLTILVITMRCNQFLSDEYSCL